MRTSDLVWACLLIAMLDACGDDTAVAGGSGGAGGQGGAAGGAGPIGGTGGGGGEGGAPPTPIGEWSPNHLASEDGDTGFEPAIAADASGHVYVPYCNLKSQGAEMKLAVSADGGETFTFPVTHKDPGSFSCDVAAAADDDGDAYVVWISYHYVANMLTSSDVMLVASHDHGASWSQPKVIESGDTDPLYFNDRPWIALDGAKSLHVSFAHIPADIAFDPDNNRVDQFYASSADEGETFSEPIAATPISPAGRIILGSFGIAAVGGDVFVPYSDITLSTYALNEVGLMRLSSDATTFTQEPVSVPEVQRASKGFPGVAGTGDNACFAFAGAVPGAAGLSVQLLQSDDAAQTFGPASVLTSEQQGLAFPATTAGANERCLVVWFDDRSGDEELFASLIEADGTVGEGIQVNDTPLELGMEQETHSGDYLNATIAGSTAFVAWGDLRSGYQEIYVSSMRIE